MATDFERMKQSVGGHSVMITSWYDDRIHRWKASAPAYSHILAPNFVGCGGCVSRDAAVNRVVEALEGYFDTGAH